VAHEYDTPKRDLERAGMTLARQPSEAGVDWRLTPTPSSTNLANLFVSNQNPGTGATLWCTNPLVQNDNVTVANGQWGTLSLEIAHA
jgi:hypothetical protein